MKQFLKLVEVAKTQGCFSLFPGGNAELYPLEKRDIEYLSSCQPIVFTPKNDNPVDLLEKEERMSKQMGLVEADLDAPFKIFSIEMVDGAITCPRPTDEIKLFTLCIMVVEVEPRQFGFYVLMERENPSSEKIRYYVIKCNSYTEITEEFCNRLNAEKVGYESSRTMIKLGTGKDKRHIRIRRIVHVAQKSYVAKYLNSGGRKIDFSHRFLVRGHWRDIGAGKIGKDREGNYCVSGYTWVGEFEKGPEKAPLITKVRFVE